MEKQVSTRHRAWGRTFGALGRWFPMAGWLVPLVLLAVLLLLAGPSASAGVVSSGTPAGGVVLASAHLAASQPASLTLTADPAILPPNGLAFSMLTADVQQSGGGAVDDGTVVVYSTTLGTFPGGLTVTPRPTGAMTVEAESGVVVTAGTWAYIDQPDASAGKVISSCEMGAEVTHTFTGTAISVLFQKQNNTGIARAYLDGELVRDIDTYATSVMTQQEELIASDLTYTPHQVTVEVSGSQNISATDYCIVLDAFRSYGVDRNGAYLTTGGQSTVTLTAAAAPGTAQVTACANPACDQTEVIFGQNLPQTLTLTANPATIASDGTSTSKLTADVLGALGLAVDDGTVVVFSTTLGTFPGGVQVTQEPTGTATAEAESGDVTKVGSWTPYSQTGASNDWIVYSDEVGAKVTYPFTGTGISVLFQKQNNAGDAHIYLDGVLWAEVDTHATSVMTQQEELIATGLPYALHQIEVMVTGVPSTTPYVLVDAFRVYGHDRNGAYLTSGGASTIDLTSIVTPGTALVTACADGACDDAQVIFTTTPPSGIITTFVPIVLRNHPAAVVTGCQELIQNPSFEDDSAWAKGTTPRPARYSTDQAKSGARSMLLGLKPGETDVHSYSSVRQTITLPSGTVDATLTFWYYPLSALDAGDRQECLLLDEGDHQLAILMRTNENTAAWTERTYDISAYAGQTVKVYFNAYNDGDGGGTTGFYLDDVSVEACVDGKIPPEPPVVPPPDTDGCYPQLLATTGVGQAPHGVAVNPGAKRVYVANHNNDSLAVVNSATYGLVTTVGVGDGPNGVAYNPVNDRIYVANRNSNSVTVLKASDYSLVETIDVGALPDGVAVNAATNRVYVANFGDDTVSIIDSGSNDVIKTVAVGDEPSMVAIDQILDKAFVSLHGMQKIAIIDGAHNVSQVSIYSGSGYGIAVDAVRHLVYVATTDTFRIAVVDGATNTFQGWVEIRRLPGEQPVPLRMIAVNPLIGTSGHVFATTAGSDGGWNRFLLLPKGWPEYFARAHAMDLGEPREGIAFEPTTLRVFVTSRSGNLVATYQDGEPACPSNFALLPEYELTVCIANPDGTCREMLTR